MGAEASSDTDISLPPERVAELLERGEVEVIEVREASEWESGWDAYNMDGGLRAWQQRKLPIEPEGGHIEGA